MLAVLNTNILKPALVNGLAISSLYGVLAIALVLTFRMSRSIAFVHGGVATFAGYLYWWMAAENSSQFDVQGWPKIPSLLAVAAFGGLAGFVFGTVVMGRMATWPRVVVTTFSLGGMLMAAGVAGTIWRGVFERVPSPFGEGRHMVLGTGVTNHQAVTVVILVALVTAMTFALQRTRLGIQVRAIADDVEAAQMAGIPVRRVATGVWTLGGALAGLAGALVVPMTSLTELAVLFVLMRSLAAAVLGGFDSLPLALAGAVLFGLVESLVGGGVFGVVSSGTREMLLMVVLFAGILLLGRRRGRALSLLEV